MVEGLPRDSHYVAAVADDDEVAEQAGPQPSKRQPPPLTDWTPEVERLTNLEDLIRNLVALANAQVSGKNPKPPKPSLRPETALQRIEKRMDRAEYERLARVLFPD